MWLVEKLHVSNYIFQLLRSIIDEEIESSLHVNNKICSNNTRSDSHMSILRVNRSKIKYCVLPNVMNSLPDVFKVNLSFSMFKSKVRNFI